ncbi:hypothetical protein M2171_002436 [Bradyrhizobium japonicum USDA 38]|nr:hypothetical protein [Bradyrhizobium japonicum USDA 38]MCS3945817.1 hypothetical protein [Bradyrhizobium japonicum]
MVDKGEVYARHAKGDEDEVETDVVEQSNPPSGPTVVVMRGDRAEERGLPQAWRDLRDQALPLVVCRDAAEVRERLQEEYPHAFREISMLTHDLRSEEPAKIRNTILLSPPGFGKTRLVRRLASLLSPEMYVRPLRRRL